MINQDTINGKWQEVKGDIQKAWGKLTNDELEQTKGDLKSIAGLVKQKYGVEQDKFHEKLDGVLSRFHDEKENVVDNIKNKLKS